MDSWNLKKLFTFSKFIRIIQNDTKESKLYIDENGKKYTIKPNNVLNLPKSTCGYDIPNVDILKLSDNSIEDAKSDNYLSELIVKYHEITKNEKITGTKKFLNYHYKRTNHKKEFVDFIKYFIKPKLWINTDERKHYIGNDKVIDDWILSKEKQFEIMKSLYIVIPFLLAVIFGIVFMEEYRAMLIGAVIAIFSTQFAKLIENIMK